MPAQILQESVGCALGVHVTPIAAGAIVLLGPPGSGKGTQAGYIANKHGLPHISTGDVFRAHAERKTALGMKAAETVRNGRLVDDDLVCNMLADHVEQMGITGCMILDGFPRSTAQAQWLELFLRKRGLARGSSELGPRVIQINVPRRQLLLRLAGRRSCPACGRSYNLNFQAPLVEGICDLDGCALIMRPDDAEAVICQRLAIYDSTTSPLSDYYRRQGQLREINGDGPVDSVSSEVARAIGDLCV